MASNDKLWGDAEEKPAEMEADRLTSRKRSTAIEKQASSCNTHGQGSRGKLRKSWRRRIEEEADTHRRTWKEIKAINWKPIPLALLCGCPVLRSGVTGTKSNWAFCHFIRKENRWKIVGLLLFAKYKLWFFITKPTRWTNFTNLFWHETLHVSDSFSVRHQEIIQCTLSNGIWHTWPGLARTLSTNLYDIYLCWVYSE